MQKLIFKQRLSVILFPLFVFSLYLNIRMMESVPIPVGYGTGHGLSQSIKTQKIHSNMFPTDDDTDDGEDISSLRVRERNIADSGSNENDNGTMFRYIGYSLFMITLIAIASLLYIQIRGRFHSDDDDDGGDDDVNGRPTTNKDKHNPFALNRVPISRKERSALFLKEFTKSGLNGVSSSQSASSDDGSSSDASTSMSMSSMSATSHDDGPNKLLNDKLQMVKPPITDEDDHTDSIICVHNCSMAKINKSGIRITSLDENGKPFDQSTISTRAQLVKPFFVSAANDEQQPSHSSQFKSNDLYESVNNQYESIKSNYVKKNEMKKNNFDEQSQRICLPHETNVDDIQSKSALPSKPKPKIHSSSNTVVLYTKNRQKIPSMEQVVNETAELKDMKNPITLSPSLNSLLSTDENELGNENSEIVFGKRQPNLKTVTFSRQMNVRYYDKSRC